jgi:hypothetical protein
VTDESGLQSGSFLLAVEDVEQFRFIVDLALVKDALQSRFYSVERDVELPGDLLASCNPLRGFACIALWPGMHETAPSHFSTSYQRHSRTRPRLKHVLSAVEV